MPKVQDLPTPAERRKATEPARRAARFKFAEDKIRKIVSTAPELTPEQREQLALILNPGAGDAA